jgi:hypothetical protein
VVPSQLESATWDVQEDLSFRFTYNAVVEPHVSSEVPNHHYIDLYATGDDIETTTQPFIHKVELKGKKREQSKNQRVIQ